MIISRSITDRNKIYSFSIYSHLSPFCPVWEAGTCQRPSSIRLDFSISSCPEHPFHLGNRIGRSGFRLPSTLISCTLLMSSLLSHSFILYHRYFINVEWFQYWSSGGAMDRAWVFQSRGPMFDSWMITVVSGRTSDHKCTFATLLYSPLTHTDTGKKN